MRRIVLTVFSMLAVGFTAGLLAQPANDDCGGAIPIELGADEASAVQVDGDTRDATMSNTPVFNCAANWHEDDVFFTLTMPAVIPAEGIVVKVYFGEQAATDIAGFGMGIYPSCEPDAVPIICARGTPTNNGFDLGAGCLTPEHTYTIRVWAQGTTADQHGTFRIAAYNRTIRDIILWEETFAGGIEANGWTTIGNCANPDSNLNAVWQYLPDGYIDDGAYTLDGYLVGSPSVCDGAVGVDSDYNDNFGIAGNFGAGPCPTPAQYNLISPAIYTGDWQGVPGISVAWTQGIRTFTNSEYFVDFRTREGSGDWTAWNEIQVNDEFAVNARFEVNNLQRHYLGGALEGDSLQLRFRYNANYYQWAIDDVWITETEAHNMQANDNWFAVPPNIVTPIGQHTTWYGLDDIENRGALDQTNVNLNLTITDDDDQSVVFMEDYNYGTVASDSLAENENMEMPINIPQDKVTTYTGVYTVTSDSATMENDYDFSNNQVSFNFATSEFTFSKETGFDVAYAINPDIYDEGAPHSYVWGCHYIVVNASPRGNPLALDHITWGISNPDDVAGRTIYILLEKWTDNNGDEIAQASEREILGVAEYTFAGDEGNNAIFDTELENLSNPGEPIMLEDNTSYFAVIQNAAEDEIQMFTLASEEYTYGATVMSQDSAGIAVYPPAVMGFSSDGNVFDIDYSVGRDGGALTHFGHNIVPLVRMVMQEVSSTKELSKDNLVDIYPNPAQERLNLTLELEKAYDEVQVQILSVDGKTVLRETLEDVQRNTYQFDIQHLNSGSYMLHILTEDGQRTQRFVVQK